MLSVETQDEENENQEIEDEHEETEYEQFCKEMHSNITAETFKIPMILVETHIV